MSKRRGSTGRPLGAALMVVGAAVLWCAMPSAGAQENPDQPDPETVEEVTTTTSTSTTSTSTTSTSTTSTTSTSTSTTTTSTSTSTTPTSAPTTTIATTTTAVLRGTTYSSTPPAGTVFENCDDAYRRGYARIPSSAPGYAPKLDSDRDGIACEDPPGSTSVLSSSETSGSGNATAGSTSDASASGGDGLAATGSATLPLVLLAIGLMVGGASALTSDVGRRWYATSDPNVRYTIDQRIPRPRPRR